MSFAHTTLPRDGGLVFDADGREHVVVAAPAGEPVGRLAAAWAQAGGPGPLDVLFSGPEPALPGGVRAAGAGSPAQLERMLRGRLAAGSVGLRLYATGDEGFVRRAAAVGLGAGLERDEIHLEVSARAARRVWCSHCKAITEHVTTSTAACAGCARTLEVFHHFSRRHGAYLGFQADAEVPGELPEPEVRWP